jgi:hypothetical protein
MTRSIILAGLLAAALAACARTAPPPIAPEATNFVSTTGFVPYCGPIWSVEGQGYRYIPCSPARSYESDTYR